MNQLVLSLFPGVDIFGMAFEAEGFCVVRGPDILLGGDIHKWSAIAGKFDGVIGGPPCKVYSPAHTGQVCLQHDLTPEFERVVREANPRWYIMENVAFAGGPSFDGVITRRVTFDNHHVGGTQYRVRSFWSNLDLKIEFVDKLARDKDPWPTVVATEHRYSPGKNGNRRASRKVGRRMSIEEMNLAMGLPKDFDTPALNTVMQWQVRGNGVPLPMGLAVARAVKRALS